MREHISAVRIPPAANRNDFWRSRIRFNRHKAALVSSAFVANEGKREHAVAGTLSALRPEWLRADGF